MGFCHMLHAFEFGYNSYIYKVEHIRTFLLEEVFSGIVKEREEMFWEKKLKRQAFVIHILAELIYGKSQIVLCFAFL